MLRLLLFLLPLQGCGQEKEEEAPPPGRETRAAPAPAPVTMPRAHTPAPEAGESAGQVLRRYYDLIEAGRYAEAWAMRSVSKAGSVEFARNFAAYERYRVTVGTPSVPVEAGGWAFVEVPITIAGRMKGGAPFGSAGSVTLRRASAVPGATARERSWHIYTGG